MAKLKRVLRGHLRHRPFTKNSQGVNERLHFRFNATKPKENERGLFVGHSLRKEDIFTS